jgi:GNAT superfamily N-acetyltransferase
VERGQGALAGLDVTDSARAEILGVERATETALPEIAALLGAVFPRPRSWLADLHWQYLENPDGAAWYVNARNESGELVAHYAVACLPPLDDPRFAARPVYLSLNTAVHPSAQGQGLFRSAATRLFDHLRNVGPSVVLGVANDNSVPGFTRSLGFYRLGRLDLRFFPPGVTPRKTSARALTLDGDRIAWRARRPGYDLRGTGGERGLASRIRHHGLPLDNLLTHSIESEAARMLPPTPRFPSLAPRLYASFGDAPEGGVPVPERLRPSPLHYICRPLPDEDSAALVSFLLARRFELVDFDVA